MKKSRKILAGVMALCLVGGVAVMPNDIVSTVSATTKGEEVSSEETAEIVKSGKWGMDGTWSLDVDGVLTISGEDIFGGLGNKLTSEEIKTVTGLVIEDGITDIATGAFKGYSSLEYVTFPDTLTSIGDEAFYGCEALYKMKFPENLLAIGKHTFYKCTALTKITIPDSVKSIAEGAFGKTGLKTLTLGRGLILIDGYAFDETSLGVADYRGTEKEWEAIKRGNKAILCDINCLVKSGDANSDGDISLADAVFIMQSLSNPDEYQLDEIQVLNADVVDAGSGLTTMDALAIQMVGINLISIEDLPATSEKLNEMIQ